MLNAGFPPFSGQLATMQAAADIESNCALFAWCDSGKYFFQLYTLNT